MDWDSMLHHISIFYAILEENVMIQTVMSFILYMLKWHLQVSDVLSCDYYYTDIFIVHLICNLRNYIYEFWVSSWYNTKSNFLCIFGEVPIETYCYGEMLDWNVNMYNVECYVLLKLMSLS